MVKQALQIKFSLNYIILVLFLNCFYPIFEDVCNCNTYSSFLKELIPIFYNLKCKYITCIYMCNHIEFQSLLH